MDAGYRSLRLTGGESVRVKRIPLDAGERLRLWPHVHGTDGFFVGVMERAS